MNDWRYDFLREDIERLRDELNSVERRTWKVERWQDRVPFRRRAREGDVNEDNDQRPRLRLEDAARSRSA